MGKQDERSQGRELSEAEVLGPAGAPTDSGGGSGPLWEGKPTMGRLKGPRAEGTAGGVLDLSQGISALTPHCGLSWVSQASVSPHVKLGVGLLPSLGLSRTDPRSL